MSQITGPPADVPSNSSWLLRLQTTLQITPRSGGSANNRLCCKITHATNGFLAEVVAVLYWRVDSQSLFQQVKHLAAITAFPRKT
jgi:hypothetical protein